LPVFESFDALHAVVPAKHRRELTEGAAFKHVLTHKDLHLHPVTLMLPRHVKLDTSLGQGQWFAPSDWPTLGLPAPVRQLLLR